MHYLVTGPIHVPVPLQILVHNSYMHTVGNWANIATSQNIGSLYILTCTLFGNCTNTATI